MAIATPEVYNEMIDRARAGKFAFPAVNITSSQSITAALQGFAEAESDGIIQVSVGGAEYGSGATIKDRVSGSLAPAAYATTAPSRTLTHGFARCSPSRPHRSRLASSPPSSHTCGTARPCRWKRTF